MGIEANPEKIKAITSLAKPKCINDVQRSAGNTADEASSLIRQAAENRPVVQFQNSQYVTPDPLPVAKYNAPREVVNCNMPYRAKTPQDIWQFSQASEIPLEIPTAAVSRGRTSGP